MRVLFTLCLFAVLSIGWAHSGFNRLSWQEDVGAYRLTVLEDFHLQKSNEGRAQLFIQLSNQEYDAVSDTKVAAHIRFEDDTVFQGDVPFLTTSSQDGDVFYAAYVLDFDISEAGFYELELAITGSLGDISKTYFVQSQQESRVPLIEYLPSALILLITLGGGALLFIPIPKREEKKHEKTLDDPNQHRLVA